MISSDRERQAPLKTEEAEPTHLARYQFASKYLHTSDIVLDAPCGSGYGTSLLARHCTSATGVDIFTGAIEHAKEFFASGNEQFFTASIEDMKGLFQVNHIFDVIISFEGIEHIHKPNKFLDEVKRLLKQDGIFIISTPRKPQGSPFHIKEYSLEEFKELLMENFIVQEIYGQVYTDFIDMLKDTTIDPHAYKHFNFVAVCTVRNI